MCNSTSEKLRLLFARCSLWSSAAFSHDFTVCKTSKCGLECKKMKVKLDPAMRFCRKILRFAVGGFLEHKSFFVSWYRLCSARYPQLFSAPRKSFILNFKAKIARENTRNRSSSNLEEKLARPYSSRNDLSSAGQWIFVSLRSLVLSPSLACSNWRLSFRLWSQSLLFRVLMAMD